LNFVNFIIFNLHLESLCK